MRKMLATRVRTLLSAVAVSTALLSGHTWFSTANALASEPLTIDEYRELMIVHPSVVDPFLNGGRSSNGSPSEPGGVWSLRTLLESINVNHSAADVNAFYASLFEQWAASQTADNGAIIPARQQALVEGLLLNQFSTVDPTTQHRVYQLWKLPFELMAIVYRPDLRSVDGTDPGELRFVYKLLGPAGEDLKFTLNMEYALPDALWDGTQMNAAAWANNFHRLGALPVGSDAYLRTLEAMTREATDRLYNFSMETRIRHVRTNELAFDPSGAWQLREFVTARPSFSKIHFVASAVDDTPAESVNGSQTLADFVLSNPVLAQSGTSFMKPENIRAFAPALLAGASNVGVKWSIPGATAATSVAVDNFGSLTCNGCHQDNKKKADGTMHVPGEIEFYQIKPDIDPDQSGQARLSKFLTSADPDRARESELSRRKAELTQLLGQPWNSLWLNYPQ